MFLDTRLGSTPRWYMSKPKGFDMRVHESHLRNVVFVGRILRKGDREEKRLTGTAFAVGVPLTGGQAVVYYLVTARHVADKLTSGEWFIRFNTSVGSCEEVRGDERAKWWVHPDPEQAPSVDVAVTPLSLPPAAEVAHVPVSMFATDDVIETHQIGVGSEAFITGLFTKMTGTSKNIPLMRHANIAMMPDEKVPNVKIGDWTGESEAYLLEVRSLGGLSGSPVFVFETLGTTVRRTDLPDKPVGKLFGSGSVFLLGLMHGHWLIREREADQVQVETVRDGEGSIATGIAVVVPAKKILEVLNHPELIARRARLEAAERERQGTTSTD